MRGMIAGRRDHFGREPYPSGAKGPRARATTRAANRHVRACRPIQLVGGRLGRRRTSNDAKERVWRPDVGAAVRSVKFCKEKARGPLAARALRFLDDATLPVICPTCQISIFNEKETKKISQIETSSAKSATKMKKPAAGLPARAV
jgi:hypothetical protein